MKEEKKIFPRKRPPRQSARMVESIYGCKWSLTVYQLLAHGINRPGEMVRSVEGLTTKVLNECLRKNLKFGILQKQVFNELPPRVEYRVTPFGERFMEILEQLESLQEELESDKAESA
ncbi:MAG TPA: helix-turn-helix domain-containing protein [Blastocatellia bacterium]|nr:helix-turn-helix domain-containing protein [Blastocatellia bacterium]